MGFGGISIWQLLIILVVVLLIFGSGKLKSLGSDLGSSIKAVSYTHLTLPTKA